MRTASLGLLLRIALRSLVGHRIKGVIVGTILAFGTFLVVVGTTLLDNVERTMEESITGSLTGHLQLVSKDAKDELVFYGPAASSEQDLSVIPAFGKVKAEIEAIDNVQAVIPMGRQMAQGMLGNELDEILARLRKAAHAGDAEAQADPIARVQRLMKLLRVEAVNVKEISAAPEEQDEAIRILDRALADSFWSEFSADPIAGLEYLDTKVAPLSSADAGLYLPYIATDLDAFAEHFHHFAIARGEMVPRGRKGFLFNDTAYEEHAKNKVARHLDKVKEAIEVDGKTIAGDPLLQDRIERGKKYTRSITEQLGPKDAELVEAELRKLLPAAEGGLEQLLVAFLDLDDANQAARHAFFYEIIAPRIRLYRIGIGDMLTVRALSQSGYMRAINVKLYGTFKLEGLERSALASAYSMMDIMSFRDLFGLMTPEKRKELDALRAGIGLEEIDRDDAEAALFGGGDSGSEAADAAFEPALLDTGGFDLDAALAAGGRIAASDAFDPADIERGMVLHAAVVLEDPARISATMAAIDALSEKNGLGIQAFHWQQVAGIVGQFILVMRVVLYVAILIIFAVALVIINNSMVMATMDRVSEIGTMRAIGARRRFVLGLFLIETLVLGLIAGGFGALLAALLITWLNATGIPAGGNDALVFLFGGPALHPEIIVGNIVLGLGAILAVGLISTFYPARIAARIAPVVAMQAKE